MKRLIALLILIFAVWAQPTAAQLGRAQPSERRVALVIGNNDYAATTKLERAVTDARAMGAELRQVGFQVIEHSNLDRRGMNQAINELVDKVSGGGVGVLFFAGHGVQVSGTNYLLPTDIKVSRAEDLVDEAIDLGRVMDRLAVAKARFALMIIDACRDNPFPRTPGRSIGAPRGLTIPSAPDGLMVVYSAGVNEQALDKLDASDRDPNGLFTREFLKQIRQPGVRVDEMVRRVRTSVREQAQRVGHAQNPAIYDQAQGEFYFVSPVATQAAVASPVAVPAAPVPPVAAAASTSDEVAYELAFWDAIKSTSAASDYEEYLRQFPAGRFAGLARARRDRLLAAAMPAAEVKPAQQAASSVGTAASLVAPTDAAAAPLVQGGVSAIPTPSVPSPTGQQLALTVQGVTTAAAQAPPAVGQAATIALLAPIVPGAASAAAAVTATQGALAAPSAAIMAAPTTASELLKPPVSLASIRGQRFFGRSQSYEIEVEAVAGGLSVLRFETVDRKIQYRCGVFKNELTMSDELVIARQVCGNSYSNTSGFGLLSYPRAVWGKFPNVRVENASWTSAAQEILLLDASLRPRFDEMVKATLGVTTQEFADRRGFR